MSSGVQASEWIYVAVVRQRCGSTELVLVGGVDALGEQILQQVHEHSDETDNLCLRYLERDALIFQFIL